MKGEAVVEWRREFEGPVELTVDQRVPGAVTVVGSDGNEVEVRALKALKGARAPAAARRLLESTGVRVEGDRDRVLIETDAPRSWFGMSSSRVRVDLDIKVPKGSRVSVDSGSGPVRVEDTRGPVRVDTGSGGVLVTGTNGTVDVDSGSGSVTVEDAKGALRIDLGSGAVSVRGVRGSVEADGSSGPVRVADVVGQVTVDTGAGPVEVDRVIGDIFVDTGSGSVRITGAKGRQISVDTGSGSIEADFDVHPSGRYTFDTGSGRISLTVPDTASFTLEVETGVGGVDCSLPLEVSHLSRTRLEGTLGDGRALIRADTSSGRVTVRGRPGTPGFGRRVPEGGVSREHRDLILKMVEEGRITADQGNELLEALSGGPPDGESEAAGAPPEGTVGPAGTASREEDEARPAGTAPEREEGAGEDGLPPAAKSGPAVSHRGGMSLVSGDRPDFKALSRQILDWMFRTNPVEATLLGVHDYDDRLGEFSREAIEERHAQAKEFLEAVRRVDPEGLDPDDRIDRELVERKLEETIRLHEDVREWRRNPYYADLPTVGVYILISRDFAPVDERLEAVLGRLKETPRVLAEGKANVTEPVRVWVETARESTRGSLMFLKTLVPAFAARASSDSLRREVEEANEKAVAAVEDYLKHLEELLPESRPEFGVGREVFDFLLRRRHYLDYDADSLYAKGQELFDETVRQMEKTAREIDPDRTWEDIVEELKGRHPRPGELLDAYRGAMADARRFVVEHGIVDLPPGEELLVEETPPFARPVIPYAAYLPPAPFETKQLGRFWVTPVDEAAPEEVQRRQLRDHNTYGIPVTALHEAYPGHHLQLCWSNRHRSDLRKLSNSTLFAEGWAFYCEELMEDLGFIAGPEYRLIRLKDQLWRAGRIILDAALHTRGMTVDEAVDFFVTKVHMERPNALAEVRRYTVTPTQPMSYLIGKLEILKLVEEYKARKGPDFDMRTFHNELLSHGTIPPAVVRRVILG
ncbi:MAG TPA: hypothetical protein DHW14_03055 [Clostridiales bacterium]|nr:hypothetical protein [Clostridiales bacterium]